MVKANREAWKKDRDEAISMGLALVKQKAAAATADNVKTAAELKRKLLLRLQRMEERYPLDATEVKVNENGKTVIFRIRDLTAAYKDLTEDINLNGDSEPVRIIIDV